MPVSVIVNVRHPVSAHMRTSTKPYSLNFTALPIKYALVHCWIQKRAYAIRPYENRYILAFLHNYSKQVRRFPFPTLDRNTLRKEKAAD